MCKLVSQFRFFSTSWRSPRSSWRFLHARVKHPASHRPTSGSGIASGFARNP